MNKTLLSCLLSVLTATPAFAEDLSKYQDEARAVALPFLKQLQAENQKEVAEGGPESAIVVCKDIAPKLAGEASRKNGIRLTRVSLKVRNPLLGMPDAWEQRALHAFESRAASGEKPEALEYSEIVKEPVGRYFRYVKAIPLQGGCVACHGATEQITDNVKAKLGEEYPHDRATGYAPGQIRGAVSIKRPL